MEATGVRQFAQGHRVVKADLDPLHWYNPNILGLLRNV